jgi:bifunctional oligoribonuclease and PAP phosphatase NrnA
MGMNDVIKKIKESDVIGITCHISPDGDSIGSSLALMLGLKKINKKPYIISRETIPDIYKFLPHSDKFDVSNSDISAGTDCLVVLDCGNVERINGSFDIGSRGYSLINIDHHLSNDRYGDINYVDTNASAVGEIVYDILSVLGSEIDSEIAACLYTAIITDCGSFKYTNTTAKTHNIAGNLICTGIDFTEIHRMIYENKPFNRIKLYAKVIDNMYLTLSDRLCVMELNKMMLTKLNLGESDTSDVVSIGMEIDSVEVAALFKEKDDGIRVSLRSKHDFDARKIAEAFGGGGHSKASGFTIRKSLQEAKDIVIKQIEKELI